MCGALIFFLVYNRYTTLSSSLDVDITLVAICIVTAAISR